MADLPAEPKHVDTRPIRTIHDLMDVHVERHARDGITRTIKEHQRLDLVEGRYSDRNARSDYNKIGARLQPGATYHDRLGSVYSVRPHNRKKKDEPEGDGSAKREPVADPAAPPPNVVPLRLVADEPPPEPPAPEPSGERLPDDDLWPFPVNGGGLIETLVARYDRHVIMPRGANVVMPFMDITTHLLDECAYAPWVLVKSKEESAGKDTLLKVKLGLCCRPWPFANGTPAAIYRRIEQRRPTLLINECQKFLPHSPALRGMLDAGHERDFAFVPRMVRGEVHDFVTFAPIVFGQIGDMEPETESRCVVVPMEPKLESEHVEPIDQEDREAMKVERRKIARWAFDNGNDALARARPVMPDGLRDRDRNNVRMILAIAERIGGPWPERLREAIVALRATQPPVVSQRRLIVTAVRNYVHARPRQPAFSSLELAGLLASFAEQHPAWTGMTPGRLAQQFLAPLGCFSQSVRIGAATPKGYYRWQLESIFRYALPKSATAATFATREAEPLVADVAEVAASDEVRAVSDAPLSKTEQKADADTTTEQRALRRRFYDFPNPATTTTEWFTPPFIFEALGCRFALDPASPGWMIVPWIPVDHHYCWGGLERPWFGFVFLNAPYGQEFTLWLDKFISHGNGVALVPDRTSTGWWRNLVRHADLYLDLSKKIRFIGADGNPARGSFPIGSKLVAIGEQGVRALENAARAGLGDLHRRVPLEPDLTQTLRAERLSTDRFGASFREASSKENP